MAIRTRQIFKGGELVQKGQLYGSRLTKQNLLDLIKGRDFIFFYGPDIGYIEKHFNIKIRDKYPCINLLRIFKRYLPARGSYKLADLEKDFKITRTTAQYKTNIFRLLHDWNDPAKRRRCLAYNMEDVLNLVRLKHIIFKQYNIKKFNYFRKKLK